MKSNAILLTMLLFVIQTPASGQNAVTTITDSRGDAVPASDGEPGSTLTEEQILITFGGMQEPQVPWKVSPAAEPTRPIKLCPSETNAPFTSGLLVVAVFFAISEFRRLAVPDSTEIPPPD